MSDQKKLIDGKTLGQRHPALRNKWRRQWLVRTRKIPCVKIGRAIFFEEAAIDEWITRQQIPPQDDKST